MATLACIAAVGVFTIYQSSPVSLDAGCDEIECMINSPTKPPGAVKVPPRTLNPAEVEKLKEALAEEEQLESKVLAPPGACARGRPPGGRVRGCLLASGPICLFLAVCMPCCGIAVVGRDAVC